MKVLQQLMLLILNIMVFYHHHFQYLFCENPPLLVSNIDTKIHKEQIYSLVLIAVKVGEKFVKDCYRCLRQKLPGEKTYAKIHGVR